MQESRAQAYIKKAEGEVAVLRNEFDRWDNIPPADETTYELGTCDAQLVVERTVSFCSSLQLLSTCPKLFIHAFGTRMNMTS